MYAVKGPFRFDLDYCMLRDDFCALRVPERRILQICWVSKFDRSTATLIDSTIRRNRPRVPAHEPRFAPRFTRILECYTSFFVTNLYRRANSLCSSNSSMHLPSSSAEQLAMIYLPHRARSTPGHRSILVVSSTVALLPRLVEFEWKG